MRSWPEGELVTSRWLKAHGYYKQLVKLYCDRGWLSSLGKGVYSRLNDQVTWVAATKTLQSQINLSLHVGGLTALQEYGVTQYSMLRDDHPSFYLYSTTATKVNLPLWFKNHFKNGHFEQKKLFLFSLEVTVSNVDGVSLKISSPERAILELLALVPNKINLGHANELMENLNRLRAPVVQELLENCLSIKVKRLFLYLAEKNKLACLNELNLKKIDLGLGKRVIGEGGHYYEKWQLSVAEDDFDNIEDLNE